MKKGNNLLLGISTSTRAKLSTQGYLEALNRMSDYQTMYELIYELGSEKKISNTEGLLLASLFGARSKDIDIDVINLKDVFRSTKISKQELTKKLDRCSGIILGTPVYFGDRSSWFEKLIEHIRTNKIDTKNKIFGMVTAGAKRNGGQETTLVFGLLDALNLGFNVVGNGPPTSQFGGTGWAGDIGKIQDDNFGIDTSMGVGKRVKRYFEIISSKATSKKKLTIGILYSGFNKKGDIRIQDLILNIQKSGVETKLIDIDRLKIKPCLACAKCPHTLETDYGCIIKDDMSEIRELFGGINGLILISRKGNDKIGKYQLFLERTRFIRRSNFIMSDVPFGVYSIEDKLTGSQLSTRIFMSFLRHNVFVVSPLVQSIYDGSNTVHIGHIDELCCNLIKIASKTKSAISKSKSRYTYKSIGYGNT